MTPRKKVGLAAIPLGLAVSFAVHGGQAISLLRSNSPPANHPAQRAADVAAEMQREIAATTPGSPQTTCAAEDEQHITCYQAASAIFQSSLIHFLKSEGRWVKVDVTHGGESFGP